MQKNKIAGIAVLIIFSPLLIAILGATIAVGVVAFLAAVAVGVFLLTLEKFREGIGKTRKRDHGEQLDYLEKKLKEAREIRDRKVVELLRKAKERRDRATRDLVKKSDESIH